VQLNASDLIATETCARIAAQRGTVDKTLSHLANSDEVPMRLILGVDAEKRVQQAEAARASEAEKWRHLTVSTVFEDGCFDSQLYKANSGVDS
jgi:uncharacterized damage-inducible protein DinB